MSTTSSSNYGIKISNTIDAFGTPLDLTQPEPIRNKCDSGSDWKYTDIYYVRMTTPAGAVTIPECSVENNNLPLDPNNTHPKFPEQLLSNGLSYETCYPDELAKKNTLFTMSQKGYSNNKSISVYSIPSECTPDPSGSTNELDIKIAPGFKNSTDASGSTNEHKYKKQALCDSNNQLYDSQFQVCVSCRDTTVKPSVISNSEKSSTPVNSSVEGNISYQCKNNPIISKDNTGVMLSQTCDSGETLINGKCVITFYAKQN